MLLGSMGEAGQARIAELPPQALANMLWKPASSESSHEPVMGESLGEVQRRVSGFQFQGLVGIAWSSAQSVASTPPLLDAVVFAAIEAMPQARPKEVLVLAQAFEGLGHDSSSHPELWECISEDIDKHFLQMEQELQTSSELPDSELVMGSLQVLHNAGCLTEKSFRAAERPRAEIFVLEFCEADACTYSYKALCNQMRFDGSSGFFQRLRFGGSTVPACSAKAAGSRGCTFVTQLRKCAENSNPPHGFLKRTVGYLGSLCSTQPQLSHTALATIRDFITILDRASDPDDVLDFALAAYFDEVVLRHFRSLMGDALEKLASGERGASTSIPPLPVLLQHCEEDFEAFTDWCGKVGDTYMYFVFLDIKGDRALLTHAAKRLQQLLRVDVPGLTANLSATRHWAQLVWKELACQRRSHTLQRMHMQALQQWLSHAKEAAVASLCDIGGRAFWDMYFCGLTKISWHDFVDGLQEQFLKNFCAQDRLLALVMLTVAKCCMPKVIACRASIAAPGRRDHSPVSLSIRVELRYQGNNSTKKPKYCMDKLARDAILGRERSDLVQQVEAECASLSVLDVGDLRQLPSPDKLWGELHGALQNATVKLYTAPARSEISRPKDTTTALERTHSLRHALATRSIDPAGMGPISQVSLQRLLVLFEAWRDVAAYWRARNVSDKLCRRDKKQWTLDKVREFNEAW
eukprot:s3127_g3.t1